MSIFGSDTPFMLLAKLKVKEDKVAEYLEIADKTDKRLGDGDYPAFGWGEANALFLWV